MSALLEKARKLEAQIQHRAQQFLFICVQSKKEEEKKLQEITNNNVHVVILRLYDSTTI